MACPLSGSNPQLSPLKIERGVAQDAAEQRPLFVKLCRPAVPGEDRRFTRMQRRQQRDNKQIAVFDAQRPALAFFITQRVDQLSDIVAQIAKRPEMVVLSGDRGVVRAGGTEPLAKRERVKHRFSSPGVAPATRRPSACPSGDRQSSRSTASTDGYRRVIR